ncbi:MULTISPECIES: peroxidase family protein [Rhodomicrobium]|uniref:peroxidase family protein n=1 Tax=Rhodomicrobium TaxID=1068 RepID=UPI000B4BDA85|nr:MULTISPECIES: peroxidase family protein [Rhodomicrobium]
MSFPAFRSALSRAFNRSVPASGSAVIAAAFCGWLAAGHPAYAGPQNDSGMFNTPGEGQPYEPLYAPRVGWPPLPERKTYYGRPDFVESGPGDEGAPYITRSVPYPTHKRFFAEERRYEEREEERDRERDDRDFDRDEDHAPFRSYAEKQARGFGRLFPEAGEHAPSIGALKALGRSMVEDGEPGDPAGDSETPAGYTFFGQFINHDVTFDARSQLGREIRGDDDLENSRTPDLDLDSVYGGGPERTPHLYRLPYIRVGRLLTEGEAPRYDLFRTRAGHYDGPAGGDAVALLGDPRDDENVVLSQLHAAFVAFHNRTVDILVERDFGDERREFCRGERSCDTQELAEALPDNAKAKIFAIAKDHVIHFYHRMIAEDYLPWVIGPQHTASLFKKGRDFYFPGGFRDHDGRVRDAYIPVEFSAAAFRFGHSQVRDRYVLREGVETYLLSDGRDGAPRAFEPVAPRHLVDWRYFFHLDRETPYGFNWARRIDPELVRSLHRLGRSNVVGEDDLGSLAARNLIRGVTLRLPSGQRVAEEMLPALASRGLLGRGAPYRGEPWRAYLLRPDERVQHFLGDGETPLWYYVLQEASVFGSRTHLHRLQDGDGERVSGDFRHRDGGFRRTSAQGPYGGPRRYDDEDNGYDGGHRLGPVGAAIVGEVLTGLLEHYREATGKGLDYRPQIKGSGSYPTRYGRDGGDRYAIANFLRDAGVAYGD